jgi:UDP-galactopyranose mutase
MSKKEYDYLIVGAGFYGSVCAHELKNKGKKVLVVESRNHIGGNCYTEKWDNINIHYYGAHIFHTSNEKVWNWMNQFTTFKKYNHTVIANYKNQIFSLPFNMWTFSKLWDITHPEEAKKIIDNQSSQISEPKNLEEQAIKLVGKDVYEMLIKGYTKKQWMKDPVELPKEIITRLPFRLTYDNSYFNDKYEGVPSNGYTEIFEKLLDGIEVRLNTNYLEKKELFDSLAEKVIYTGPIDKFFKYELGKLEYKTLKFAHKRIDTENYQGCSVMNYTDYDVPYTRTIEHKHFEKSESDVTWVTWEYPVAYIADETEAYYPVNDKENNEMYQKYKKMASELDNVHFGGRLGEYKYYDMDKVIESALNFVENLKL